MKTAEKSLILVNLAKTTMALMLKSAVCVKIQTVYTVLTIILFALAVLTGF